VSPGFLEIVIMLSQLLLSISRIS